METVAEQFIHLYQEKPSQPAVHLLFSRQPDQTITRAEFTAGALAYARSLKRQGIQPGEVVILILQHGEDLLYSFFGCVLHGAIPAIMPFLTEKLSPEQYRRSLKALFEVTAPSGVVTYQAFLDEVRQALGEESSLKAILVSEEHTPETEVDLKDLAGLERAPQDIVLLQHSSGTTGLQKGIALSHQAVFNQLTSYRRAIDLRSEDVIVSWLPLYHDMGLIAGFLLPILSGIPLVLMSPFDWVRAPYRLMQAVATYKGSLTWLPNFAYNFCAQKIRERDLAGVDLTSWRAVINCSEPMHWKSHQIFAEKFAPYGLRPGALATCYAMAENVFAVSQGGINLPVTVDRVSQSAFISDGIARPAQSGEDALMLLSAGKPVDNTEVKILDDQRQELPERRIGEIALRSTCMLTGYYKRPDLAEKAFHQGWYLTGDVGYLADGEVYVTGRKKDMLIVGGKNIYPQDLEALANDVPGVYPGRVVAFGVFNETTGTEDVVLLAELDGDLTPPGAEDRATAAADEIRRAVTKGTDIALRHVQIVDHGWLLKTSSGKIARGANREKYLVELGHHF